MNIVKSNKRLWKVRSTGPRPDVILGAAVTVDLFLAQEQRTFGRILRLTQRFGMGLEEVPPANTWEKGLEMESLFIAGTLLQIADLGYKAIDQLPESEWYEEQLRAADLP